MMFRLMVLLGALVIMSPVAVSAAECDISGTIEASPNPDPMGPDWMYTAIINWNTGSQYALSHISMLLDIAGGTCSCTNFQNTISWGYPIGFSGTSCPVSYYGELNCQGDPSIPGVFGIALKLEPTGDGCEPGTSGQGTFVFYSDLPPAEIDEEALTLVDKFGLNHCWGTLSGDFPSMPCNPVGTDHSSFGTLKGMFR